MKSILAVACLALLSTRAPAQCTNPWLSFGPPCGVGGPISAALAWDPDGPGPLPERLVVGGDFTTAGNVLANNIAVWDPATGAWSALGGGCNGSVYALATLPNGRLVAGGRFTTAGGVPVGRIAEWDGVAWSPLGSGSASQPVQALAVLPNGDLIAGGPFSNMGGVPVNCVARWNGSAWSALAGGSAFANVFALAIMPNGDVVAGGFGLGPGYDSLARWDGSTWASFGAAAVGAAVRTLAVAGNGDLIAGGSFTAIGGVAASNVARWNGVTWAALGSGTAGVQALRALANGDVVAASGALVTRWNGNAWAPLGAGMRGPTHRWPSLLANATPEVRALTTLPGGALIAAGNFALAGAASAQHVARWDGAQWSALSTGQGVDGIADFALLPGGDVVAVGNFAAAGTLVTNAVARWNGTTWSTLGSAGTNQGGVAHAITRLPNGDLVVAGAFSSIGGVAANNVARWDGRQWSPIGTLGPGGDVYSLALAPDGTLFAGGSFYLPTGAAAVAAWNGTTWNPVGSQLATIFALTVLADGRLLAGGWPDVAIWDGVVWTQLGNSTWDSVFALAELPSGDLVAAGLYGRASGIVRRWNGASWATLGVFGGPVEDLHVLPNGDLLAAGWFGPNPSLAAAGVARWNGAAWSAVGGGVGGRALALTAAANGEVWVGGSFATAGGAVAGGFARLTTTCAATAQTQGAGCAGNTVSGALPWTGSTWRASASGLPNSALVFAIHGFATTSLPLVTAFPTALAGCTLHVQPDFIEWTLSVNGAAAARLELPNNPLLAGVVFHHQMVAIALDGTQAVTATNSLRLTLGSF